MFLNFKKLGQGRIQSSTFTLFPLYICFFSLKEGLPSMIVEVTKVVKCG